MDEDDIPHAHFCLYTRQGEYHCDIHLEDGVDLMSALLEIIPELFASVSTLQ